MAPPLIAAPIGLFESLPHPTASADQTPSQPAASPLAAAAVRIKPTAASDGDTIQTLADLFPEVPDTNHQGSQDRGLTTGQRSLAFQPPVPPPAPPLSADLTDLTLAGMDDLFAATPAAPSQRPTPPAETAADTLDALFTNFTASLDGPSSPTSSPTSSPAADSMVTLEDIEQLFADVPAAPPKSF